MFAFFCRWDKQLTNKKPLMGSSTGSDHDDQLSRLSGKRRGAKSSHGAIYVLAGA